MLTRVQDHQTKLRSGEHEELYEDNLKLTQYTTWYIQNIKGFGSPKVTPKPKPSPQFSWHNYYIVYTVYSYQPTTKISKNLSRFFTNCVSHAPTHIWDGSHKIFLFLGCLPGSFSKKNWKVGLHENKQTDSFIVSCFNHIILFHKSKENIQFCFDYFSTNFI